MRYLVYTFLLAAALFAINQTAFAVCMQTGNTPSGGNIINCPPPVQTTGLDMGSNPGTTNQADEVNIPPGGGINTNIGTAIFTADGNDTVFIEDGEIIATDGTGIQTSNDDDIVIVNGGNIESAGSCIALGIDNDTATVNRGNLVSTESNGINGAGGNDIITVNGDFINGFVHAVRLAGGNDILTVNGGTLKSVEDILITGGSGNDEVILNGGVYMPGTPVTADLGTQDDSLRFGNDIQLNGIIDCGPDFDTLIFAMDVPEETLALFSSEIAAATVPDGSVTINGVFYEWENCELLVNQLNGVRVLRPIPTLSQWGLIAMAGLIGIAALLSIRRKALV